MQNEDVVFGWTTAPDAATGELLARALIEGRFAACVNRIPGVVSTYRWKGAICTDVEELLLIKTTGGRIPDVAEKLRELHPYETVAWSAAPVCGGAAPYLDWVRAETRPVGG